MKSGIFIPKPVGSDELLRTEPDQKWQFMWTSGVLDGPGRIKTEQKFDIEPRQIRKSQSKLSWTEWSVDPCMKYRPPRRSYLRTRPIVTVKTYILKNTFQIL